MSLNKAQFAFLWLEAQFPITGVHIHDCLLQPPPQQLLQ